MSTLRTAGAAAGLLLALTVAPPVAAGDHHGDRDDSGPDEIALPTGWRPEGIATDGRSLYVGSLANGAIWEADPRTGEGEILAEGVTGRVAVGVTYDWRRDLLWVAGGPTGEVRAQDADTGDVLATYSFPSPDATARFLNDLTVTHHGVYVTDSQHAELAVIPFGDDDDDRRHDRRHGDDDTEELPAADAVEVLPLTGDLVMQEGFNLNGITSGHGYRGRHGHHGHHDGDHDGRRHRHGRGYGFGHGLIAIQSNTGTLLRIDPRTGETDALELDGDPLVNGDGIELDRDGRLWVLRNQDNLLVEVRLGHRSAAVEDEVTDAGFDVPSTGALLRDSFYAVNARFGITSPETADFWITRVDLD